MFFQMSKTFLDVTKVQVKLTLLSNLAIAILFLVLAPIIFGINNLDPMASSFVLERFVSLIGIILLTPIFLPEQNKNIGELVESKYTSINNVYISRIVLSVMTIFILICIFVYSMILNASEFPQLKFIIGTFATSYFLGAIGFLSYAISNNVVVGYLLSLAYYGINLTSKPIKLKNLYLFSLSYESFKEKYYLLVIGTIFIFVGVIYKYIIRKVR